MHLEVAFIALFSVATAVALLARRLRVPYTVALVVAGLVLGAAHLFEPPHLTKELLYAVFLPGLIFEAAFALQLENVRRNKIAILSLALPGLLVAIALTAVILTPVANGLHFGAGFTLLSGAVFASLIAATDPIAVVGLFKTLGVPKRLAVLVEGESLLNDGTAVVVFTLILSVALGKPASVGSAILDFVRVVGMGVFVGLAVGFAVSWVIHKVDDPMIEITLTTIAAYGSFVAAENFHFSGVIATVVAGMLCGNYAARTGMSPSTRVAVATFWEYLAFALNSVIFLLIGFAVRIESLLQAWQPILVAFAAVTLGRAAVTYLAALFLRPTRERLPWKWAGVLTWGGLRGGLSMVLALGLPSELPHRDLIVAMTFGVVVLSILIQGTTMAPLLRWLGLVAGREGRRQYDRMRVTLRAQRAALAEVDELVEEGELPPETTDALRRDYQERIKATEVALGEVGLEADGARAEDKRLALRRVLAAEKDAVLAAHRAGQLDDQSYEHLLADVDARLQELGHDHSD